MYVFFNKLNLNTMHPIIFSHSFIGHNTKIRSTLHLQSDSAKIPPFKQILILLHEKHGAGLSLMATDRQPHMFIFNFHTQIASTIINTIFAICRYLCLSLITRASFYREIIEWSINHKKLWRKNCRHGNSHWQKLWLWLAVEERGNFQ